MKKSLGFPLVALVAWLVLGGCMRNDDEPEYPTRPIARLYVSIEDVQLDASKDDIDNVVLIDPADTLDMYVALNHNSNAVGGAGIYFNPFVSRLFQAGYNDTTIRVMTVGNLGTLGNSGNIGNELLKQMRGIVYHHPTQLLYVASNATPTTIYGFYQPMNRNGFTKPDRVLRLGSEVRPWSVLLWNDSLLVSNSGENGGVSLYGNLSQVDSLAPNFQAISTVRIEGAATIRGIAFVDSLDLLVAADYGVVTSGTRITDGKVYIIEGIKAHLANPSATVSPTRTISGSLTGLTGPVDVAIDPRGTASRRTIFVADRDGRTISRFPLSANGNVAPETTVTLDTLGNVRRPFGIYFDVRGDAVQQ
ncbi:hypothetical protein [Parapedobacter sp. 2B3]|uniref:hypothetical protein n=1 Tax=Parapedobacter sp. 2B3 TaxID=3342381 RepID=UPI0035B5E7AB